MKIPTCIVMVSTGLCSIGWSDEPHTPVAQPAAAQTPAPSAPRSDVAKPAAATAAPAATATPAKLDTSQVVNVADTNALIKQMRGRGYKPLNRNGILVFCRREGELGTHFERERCNTIDELKRAELSGQEYTKQIQQQGSPTPFDPVGQISKP
jgi:3-oxoacyl-ACP reductase-like protein